MKSKAKKDSGNAVNKAKHSMNIDRTKKDSEGLRSRATVKRLQMYRNSKAKRNEKGQIVRPAPFQSKLPSGTMAHIEPNRRWFGNTRVITQDALQKFKEAVNVNDPFKVILRRSKLPVTLLNEKKAKVKHSVDTGRGKKPNIAHDDAESYVKAVKEKCQAYKPEDDRAHMCLTAEAPHNSGERVEARSVMFDAGHNRRLWGELYKVVDSSDVIIYVLDARNPLGTRSEYFEKILTEEKPHVHLVYVLNKCDLLPKWAVKRWKAYLCKTRPTIAFRASVEHCFGKKDLISLLQQMSKLHSDKQQISVGIVGYPNVGKSSLINALKGKVVCKVAPIPGETKVWQYITLMKRIYLIDCPGVVPPEDRDDIDAVLKGVVRVERLLDPENYIDAVLSRVKAEYMQLHYDLKSTWNTSEEFLEKVAEKKGKLLKGGEPDIHCVAKIVLNDFQRGKLPYFCVPPEETEVAGTSTKVAL